MILERDEIWINNAKLSFHGRIRFLLNNYLIYYHLPEFVFYGEFIWNNLLAAYHHDKNHRGGITILYHKNPLKLANGLRLEPYPMAGEPYGQYFFQLISGFETEWRTCQYIFKEVRPLLPALTLPFLFNNQLHITPQQIAAIKAGVHCEDYQWTKDY